MTEIASWRACRGAILLAALLSASRLFSQSPVSRSPAAQDRDPAIDGAWGQSDPSHLGSDANVTNGRLAVSVDVLRHPLSEKARRAFQRALETFNAGHDEAAREQLVDTLGKYPDSAPYVHSVLGVIYVRMSRFEDAVTAFEQAVSFLPHDATTHYNLGLSLACARDYARAEQETRKALELDPKSAPAQALWHILQDHRPEILNSRSESPSGDRGSGN